MRSILKAPKEFPHPPHISWQILSVVVVLSLLVNIGVFIIAPIVSILAQHEGEQTAEILPQNIEVYLSVNLRPGASQIFKFWNVANNWWQDPAVQELWEELTGEIESETDIDIEADVLPWLGPEIAGGVRNAVPNGPPYLPETIALIGTMDNGASDAFIFDTCFPAIGLPGWDPATGTLEELDVLIAAHTDYYRGIKTLTFQEDDYDAYIAFTDDYIIFSLSPNGDLFYETLDLLLNPALPSLADTARFQEARSKLPSERVLMFYCNAEQIWAGVPQPPEIIEEIWSQIGSSLPPYMTGSLSFADSGIIYSFYYRFPLGMTPPGGADNMLYSSQIVPEDAQLFYSTKDINASWLEMKSQIEENWDDIRDTLEIEPADWPVSFADALEQLDTEYGVDVDQLFGLMDQELALAMFEPIPIPDGEGYIPTGLIMNELSDADMTQAPGLMLDVEGVVNKLLLDSGKQLVFENVGIDGIIARMPTTVSWEELVGPGISRPGYMFLEDVPAGSTTNFMVIGFEDGLEAAVAVHNGAAPSLSGEGEFQALLSMLPVSRTNLGYVNINRIIDTVLSMLSGEDRELFQTEVVPFIEQLQSAGFSTTVTEDGIMMRGTLTILAAPAPTPTPTQTHTWTFHTAGFFPSHLPDSYTEQIVLANLGTIPGEVQGVYWYDCNAIEWKFWAPGAPGTTLTTLGGGHTYDYMVTVTGDCDWEVPLP